MEHERRQNSIEMVLITLGKLEKSSEIVEKTVIDLNTRVGLQNGKVGKLQEQYAFMRGCIAVLILTVLPIIINFISSWLKFTFAK